MYAILVILATFSVLALYFILLHLQVYLVTIMKATSMLDGVSEIYSVLAVENNSVYAGPVVRVSVYRLFHSSDTEIQDDDKQETTASSPRFEDDAVSVLSELTEISEPRVAWDNERSDEESEVEVSSIPRVLHGLVIASPRFHSPRFTD